MTFWAPWNFPQIDKNLDKDQMIWRKLAEIVTKVCLWIEEAFFLYFINFLFFYFYIQEKSKHFR